MLRSKMLSLVVALFMMVFFSIGCQSDNGQDDGTNGEAVTAESSSDQVDLSTVQFSEKETDVAQTARVGGAWNAIVVDGFYNFIDNGTPLSMATSKIYWAQWTHEMNARGIEVENVPWDIGIRLEDQLSYFRNMFMGYINAGHCANQCVVFTHSTGGLVIDILLSRSLASEGTGDDFSVIWDKVAVVVPIASAAGGVHLADYAIDLAMGTCDWFLVGPALMEIMGLVFPNIQCGVPSSGGTAYDLKVPTSRAINGSNYTATPHLQIAGNGNFVGNIVTPFLTGTNDGLVAMHSSCGGSQYGSYESCASNRGPDGRDRKSFSAPGNYPDHYAYVMTEEGHGSQPIHLMLTTDFRNVKSETVLDNRGYSNISNSSYTTGMWWWKKYYKKVSKGEKGGLSGGHLSDVVVENFIF